VPQTKMIGVDNKYKILKAINFREKVSLNPELSLKHKALIAMIINFEGTVTIEELEKICSDRKSSISSGLRELEEKGFIKKIRERDTKTGRWLPPKYELCLDGEECAFC
jgi:predicted transcriptional regulator